MVFWTCDTLTFTKQSWRTQQWYKIRAFCLEASKAFMSKRWVKFSSETRTLTSTCVCACVCFCCALQAVKSTTPSSPSNSHHPCLHPEHPIIVDSAAFKSPSTSVCDKTEESLASKHKGIVFITFHTQVSNWSIFNQRFSLRFCQVNLSPTQRPPLPCTQTSWQSFFLLFYSSR